MERSSPGVTRAREAFRQHATRDRESDEPKAHGFTEQTPTLFFSLLSTGTQDALRGFLYGGWRPANEDAPDKNSRPFAEFEQAAAQGQGSGTPKVAPTPAPEQAQAQAQAQAQERPVSPQLPPLQATTEQSPAMAVMGGVRRVAMAAYAQGIMASPDFTFARPAESLNLTA